MSLSKSPSVELTRTLKDMGCEGPGPLVHCQGSALSQPMAGVHGLVL